MELQILGYGRLLGQTLSENIVLRANLKSGQTSVGIKPLATAGLFTTEIKNICCLFLNSIFCGCFPRAKSAGKNGIDVVNVNKCEVIIMIHRIWNNMREDP